MDHKVCRNANKFSQPNLFSLLLLWWREICSILSQYWTDFHYSLTINKTRTNRKIMFANRYHKDPQSTMAMQWSGRSWFLYQVSAFPCVTAMGWAAHGPGWRADWIYWGEIYVSRITPWLGPGSRVQVPNTGPYPVPGHWNPRGEEAPAQPPPRTAETKEKPAENKHSRHQHRHLQQWSQSSRK